MIASPGGGLDEKMTLPLRVVGNFKLVRQRLQVIGRERVERQDRVQKLNCEVYVMHRVILMFPANSIKQ